VPFHRRSQELVLLWSLGVDDPNDEDTIIAPTMGRMRRLGDPLIVPGAASSDLEARLGLVGLDCECGLDRKWMQGVMVPHDWTTDDEAKALAVLGFDPGNPLVVAEIQRILSRGGAEEGRGGDELGRSAQYEEVTVGGTVSPASRATVVQPASDSGVSAGLWVAIGILTAMVAVGVGVVFVRSGGDV